MSEKIHVKIQKIITDTSGYNRYAEVLFSDGQVGLAYDQTEAGIGDEFTGKFAMATFVLSLGKIEKISKHISYHDFEKNKYAGKILSLWNETEQSGIIEAYALIDVDKLLLRIWLYPEKKENSSLKKGDFIQITNSRLDLEALELVNK